MAARHCDVDHTDDWMSSKDSRRCNLACLCRKHHLFKHLTGSDLIQIRPGILGWTTPLGQRYVTRPEPYPDELPLAAMRGGCGSKLSFNLEAVVAD
jgi:hypothetical protein